MTLIQEASHGPSPRLGISFSDNKAIRDSLSPEAHNALVDHLVPEDWQIHMKELHEREQAAIQERVSYLALCKENFTVMHESTELPPIIEELATTYPEYFL